MKTRLIMLMMAVLTNAVICYGKDIRVVVFKTEPEMHCNNCETKIKNNMRFEKGIKDIETNLSDKTVTIKYDADKTTIDNLIAGFEKINYRAYLPTDEVATIVTETPEPVAQGTSVAYFKAAQIGCGGCATKVKNLFADVDGVSSVDVDMATKSVKIVYDASKLDVDKLKGIFATIDYATQVYYPDNTSMAYVSFLAEQIKCGGCAGKVYRNIMAEEGVKDVTVCLNTKAVSIAYDASLTDVEKLMAGFKKFDYVVTECYNKKK